METYQPLHQDSSGGWKARLTTFSPICCCFWCFVVTAVLLTIFLPLIFLVWIPNAIQENVDYGTFSFVSVSLSNATNESVFMNATIQISNTGGYDATIDGFTSKAYLADGGGLVGTLKLPETKIKANEGATILVERPLFVENITNFRTFAGHVLAGVDMTLRLSGDASIDVTISAGVNVVTDITIDSSITMKGVTLQDVVASNMMVESATTSDIISATLDMSWGAMTLSQLGLSFDNVRTNIYDTSYTLLGYATIDTFEVVPGYNSITSVPVTIERTSDNSDSISTFLGNYLMGNDQTLIVVGPIPTASAGTTVVDYGLTLAVTAQGSDDGDVIIGGIITAESQQGWKVEVDGDEVEVKGAYSSVRNSLDVNITIVETSANLYLAQELEYGFNKSTTVSGYPVTLAEHCDPTSSYARIYSGEGMYKDEPDQTTVNVSANSVTSFFAQAQPVTGQYNYNTADEVDCSLLGGAVTFDYPCCFLFVTTAAICRDNPNLIKNSSNELTQAFIELSVDANLTVLIDDLFEVEVSYQQEFMPLSFGDEMYQGYTEALGFQCEDVILY